MKIGSSTVIDAASCYNVLPPFGFFVGAVYALGKREGAYMS